MKKRFFLFGVPSLFTVFVILMVLSFASLAYLNVSQETKAMKRGNVVLTESYTLLYEGQMKLKELQKDLDSGMRIADWVKLHNLNYNRLEQRVKLEMNTLSLSLKLTIELEQGPEGIQLKVVENRLVNGIDQDYSQNGNPVFGG
ncbi:MAG TPA: hypothetical protein DIC19_06050 [Erysipelotrichaceae bacterium]|nr:hypothetical protein [Erysipelotrichaceae bacterium]